MRQMLVLIGMLFALLNASFAHEPGAPSSIEHYALEQVSPHIYVVHGTQALPNPESRGFMNNPAAIIGREGVIIVDPGSSREIARQLLEKVGEVTDNPVVAVINTHVHGDHWLGNHGIREQYPEVPIYAHSRMIERVEAGAGEEWISLFIQMTEGAVSGTRVVAPNIGLEGGEEISLAGLRLNIYHAGHAHTDHDLMIEVVDDGGLFFGDIVAARRVPNSDVPGDANFKGSKKAIERMLMRPNKIYVPGHGHSGGREVPEATLRFIKTLYASVQKYFDQGLLDYEMQDRVIDEMAEYEDWNNFSEMARVISFVYQEIESDSF